MLGKRMVNVWVVVWSMNMSSILHITFDFPVVLTTHSRLGRVGCRAETHGVGRRIFGAEEVGKHRRFGCGCVGWVRGKKGCGYGEGIDIQVRGE